MWLMSRASPGQAFGSEANANENVKRRAVTAQRGLSVAKRASITKSVDDKEAKTGGSACFRRPRKAWLDANEGQESRREDERNVPTLN